jgi:RNA polymerase sigma factor (sigma-70 family)
MRELEFKDRLQALRPRLHRFCARMTGSSVDGEDVLQDTLLKAWEAHAAGLVVENLEAWLLRVAHNGSMDVLRRRSRNKVVPLNDDIEGPGAAGADHVAVSFRTFLHLPELQRCAVILKDVLGHSIEEIAAVADCSPAAAKSALQRGRVALRRLVAQGDDVRLPRLSDEDRLKIATYVRLFQGGDFERIRAMLADDVKLELVNRLKLDGRDSVGLYFTRYAQETKWRFAFGAVEGHPSMLVFDASGKADQLAHFVLLTWRDGRIAGIRDFLFASYAVESIDWVRLG